MNSTTRILRRAIVSAAVLLASVPIGVLQSPAHADVTSVKGSAYGYFSSLSLFGAPASTRGPSPSVTLPPGGASPISSSATSGLAQYGPAIIFSSGQLNVSTQGTTGPSGSVTSSTNIASVNTSGQEVFTASNVASSCAASQTGVSGSTTITNGTLQTSEGNPDVDGDETVVNLPTNPAPNTTINGQVDGESFQYIFNQQIVNPDGSITVYAAHQRFLGPNAVGDLFIGKSECGVTPPPAPSIVVDDVTKFEGDIGRKTYRFTIRRIGALSDPASVQARTVNGSAKARRDYVALPQTAVAFAVGEATKQVTVKVKGDTAPELNEKFFVVLSDPVGATIIDGSGRGKIRNDD